jgi:hypothetical protein
MEPEVKSPAGLDNKIFAPSSEPVQRASGIAWLSAAAASVLFLVLIVSLSLTRGPWWDEGLFADVAVNFRDWGHLRSSVLAPFSFDNMPEVDRYMFWQLPAYPISLGTWFRLVPVSPVWMRMFSALWGCLFVGSWFLFVRTVSRNETLALLIASVVALDFSTLSASSNGRMDMMCAALGWIALAAYASLRYANAIWADISVGLFGAASLLCHPMGFVTNGFLIIFLVLYRRSLHWRDLSIIACPYLIGGALCLHRISEAPQIFLAQARAAASYRVGGLAFLLSNIASDFRDRYLQFYFAPHSGTHKLKVFSLLFGVAGILILLLDRKVRATLLSRFLMLSACLAYLGVALLDDLKYPHYFVYVTPILSACGAVWLCDSFRGRRFSRWIGSGLFLAFCLANIAGCAYYIHRNDFANEYKPVVAKIESLLGPGDIVMGPSELGFALGFGPPLIDDCTLGFTSGKQPRIYVLYPACRIPGYTSFIWDWSRKRLASDYHPVLERGGYTVYLRNTAPHL